jgi:murein DD-endopeptidase MepM/ murein hydrolase activator NlpD
MPRPQVPSCPRLLLQVAAFALIGFAVAGCENSARFTSDAQIPPRNVTGSIGSPPVSNARIEQQPLPAPSRPATVAAARGDSYGNHGYAAYRPQTHSHDAAPAYYGDVTGSVPVHHAPPKAAGHWTWNGGSAVIVGRGETLDMIARRHGVPISAIMQANGLRSAAAIHPGERLVIPRYVHDVASRAAARVPAPIARNNHVHVVEPGETLMELSRRSGVPLGALARANKIQPYTKIQIGQRLVIPGGRDVAERPSVERKIAARHQAAPKIERPRRAASKKVVREKVAREKNAGAPTQSVQLAKAEVPQNKSVAHKAETVAAMPSFRWPVRGRIIAGFGRRPNGTENDGINLAVPEGTPIKAADDGVVAYAGNELKGYGNLVLIRHPDGYVSAYADASKLLVKRGQKVRRGQVIARAGQTGNVSSPQLHFEIRKGSTPVDPLKYLNGA